MTFQEMVDSDDDSSRDRQLGQFLNFLARDIYQNPQHLQAVSSDLVNRIRSLVAHVDIDLNMPLLDEDE